MGEARSLIDDETRALDASTFEAERRLTWLRLLVMASGTILFPILQTRMVTVPGLAYALLVTGWVYSIGVLVFEPYRRYPILVSASLTTFIDITMTLLWIFATGGVESPWCFAIIATVVLLSLRYRPKHVVVGSILCASGYVLAAALFGQLTSRPGRIAIHVLYIFVCAAAAAIVSKERLGRARARLGLLDLTQEVGQLGTWEWSVRDQKLTWSDELYRIVGLPIGVPPTLEVFLPRVHPEDRAEVERLFAKVLETGESFRNDHRLVRPDGSVRWVHCRGRGIAGSDGTIRVVVGSMQDITDRRALESQVQLSGKLASIGALASGVAHEIKNPLGYVLNNLEVVAHRLDAVETKLAPADLAELRKAVAAVRHGSERIQDIVGGLQTFARPGDDRKTRTHLARAVDLAIELASHEIKHRACLTREYGETPPVIANEPRLSQVIVNLLVNAAHAIEQGSRSENEIRVRVFDDGRGHGCVEVSDTGVGISDAHRDRIFDPFFTTKQNGMGLGLSVSRKLMREFGGELELLRTSDEGSTFRVSIPIAPSEMESSRQPIETPKTSPRRKRLLVVDDEARYAESLRLLLGEDHDVGVATDVKRALEILEQEKAFDVILCDMMMPGRTGMELYEDLAKTAPELCARMVFLTGGATNERTRAFLARPGIRHLEKPVALPALEEAIERASGEGRSA